MDFSDYINSKDIREYHKKIGYEYNSLEAAWLVFQHHHLTLDERHVAWQWIIDKMPDQIINVGKERKLYYGKSLNKILSAYMNMQKSFIDEFESANEEWLYAYKPYYQDYYGSITSNGYSGYFTSWDKCLEYIKENEESEDAKYFIVGRGHLNEPDLFKQNGIIEIDISGQIMNVLDISAGFGEDDENLCNLDRFFEDLWFEFPVPFKPGDIVCLKDYSNNLRQPIVLTDIVFPRGLDHDEWRKNHVCGDNSDMLIWGYCMGEIGGDDYFGLLLDSWWNYMDAEYYPEELTGCYRALKPVSSWIKGELGDDVTLLLAAYHHIMTEEHLKRNIPVLFTKEGLKLAGFSSAE